MLKFRPFRNADPPLLAALWRNYADRLGPHQPVSPELLDRLVFAKQYFDPTGLILAYDGERPVGFAHAGFGPNEARDNICTNIGCTCLILTDPEHYDSVVVDGLLERCETYLLDRGARFLFGGGPMQPFYVGFFDGCDLPGVPDRDATVRQAFESRGYSRADRAIVMQRELGGPEIAIDRRQLKIRRQTTVEATLDAPAGSWWEACVLGEFNLTRFRLKPRCGGPVLAVATFRDMTPGGSSALEQSVCLADVSVNAEHRRGGLARFLLCEAFRWFARRGIKNVGLRVFESKSPAVSLVRNLGFKTIEEGSVWRKDVEGL